MKNKGTFSEFENAGVSFRDAGRLMKGRRAAWKAIVIGMMLCAGVDHSAAQDKVTLKSFFKEHCIKCHGPDLEEGGLRIDQLTGSLTDFESLDDLQNILDEMTIDAMPPEEEPRPASGDLVQVIELINKHLKKAAQKNRSSGGRPSRRLTKIEYTNTVFDLLGVRIDGSHLPDDGGPGVFDTDVQALYTTDIFFESYLEVARLGVSAFIESRDMKPGTKKIEPEVPSKRAQTFILNSRDIPPAGHLKARIPLWIENPKEKARREGDRSKKLYTGPVEHALDGFRFEVNSTKNKPLYIERTLYKSNESAAKGEIWSKSQYLGIGAVEYTQVVNPQPYLFFQPFLAEAKTSTPPDSAAGPIIEKFMKMVNRGREMDLNLMEALNEKFLEGRKRGESFWEAMVEPLALSMSTVEVMFHLEDKKLAKKLKKVPPIDVANRMAYLLWRSAPDGELIKLAQSEELNDDNVINQQIERMMKDERFDRFIRDFSKQWLELDRQDVVAVNDILFKDFRESMKSSFKEETIQFMSHIIKNNLTISNLIDSDFVLVDDVMAKHYGLTKAKGAKVKGTDFQVVQLPPESRRGGILTHAGILMQTGTGDRSSIVERGVFVNKKILGYEPPPPPPLVNDLPSRGSDFLRMNGAELVRKHASTPQCASCHNKIDPLGLGLEEFDALGLYRTKDVRVDPDFYNNEAKNKRLGVKATFTVDLETKGRLVSGERFEGFKEFQKALIKKEDRLATAYIEALVTFANGKEVGVTERSTVGEALKSSKRARYPAGSILKNLVKSMVSDLN